MTLNSEMLTEEQKEQIYREAHNAYMRQWYHKNKKHRNDYMREWKRKKKAQKDSQKVTIIIGD